MIKTQVTTFYELAPLTLDVICSKLWRDGENIVVSICQTNTLLIFKASFDLETLKYIYLKHKSKPKV